MIQNNPFEVHGIKHLSPSSIGGWIGDLPMWLMRYLYGINDRAGVGAFRGIAVESALQKKYEDGSFDYDYLENEFIKICNDNQIDLDSEKAFKEHGNLINFATTVDRYFNYTELETYQEKVEINFDDLPVPILGYIDFNFKDVIVDLKTTGRMPRQPSEGHLRQMAFYSLAYPEKEVHLFYATHRDWKVFKISKNTLKVYQEQLLKIAFAIQNYLSQSEDKVILTNRTYPNFDKWEWSDFMKNEAKKIWS